VAPVITPAYAAVAGATPNVGSAAIGIPQLSSANAGKAQDQYAIRFVGTPVTGYEVDLLGADGITVANGRITWGTYDSTSSTVQLPDGISIQMLGQPDVSDTFLVKPVASNEATSLNIFDTFDSIIKSLEVPLNGDPIAAAAFQNTLATAMQRLDVNYDNVLTVRASVGARLNEIDALHANGSMRALSYSNQLSKLEDVDYYSATTQLQLRTTALEAASLAFKKIQSIGLFNQR
jgi:flagellar hook-associated protein 3 FlgL